MVRPGVRRVAPILLTGALVLPVAGGCGGADMDGGSSGAQSREPIPTARLSPPDDPRRETLTLARGTTGWVGGLRLGIGRAADDVGTVVILEGRDVPSQDNWRVSGRAGTSRRFANGYTVTIEEVVNARSSQETGSGGGSVTVTVTPPN
jgi:hypothetical protein